MKNEDQNSKSGAKMIYPVRIFLGQEHHLDSAPIQETRGEVTVQFWTPQVRTTRAIKAFFLCWGLAFVAVFIPLLHFFLVPGFLIAGPIYAYRVFQQQSIVLGGEGACPKCGKPLMIVRGPNQWPLSDLCSQCQTIVSIERLEGKIL